jgi:para-aminobenzoate synthetase/4-amino-4-deoxychorismate lyase
MNRRHSLPAEVYALVEQTPATVLLEGAAVHAAGPPWTQLFTNPLRVCAAYAREEIPALFDTIEDAVAAGRFAAGFFSYECGPCFEPKAAPRQSKMPAPPATPLAWFGIYDRSYAFDHDTGTFAGGEPPQLERLRRETGSPSARRGTGSPPKCGEQARREHEVSGHDFIRAEKPPENEGALAPAPDIAAEFAISESDYACRIAAIHEWIRAGDVYQLNFTAPFRVEAPGGVATHYARLRSHQPVDYGAFIHWQPGHHILSFSPELFFRIDRDGDFRRIVTRPMKGTAPRGRTTREDHQIVAWLRNDPKNRAENVMIVDLLRNDLGRVARFGTVQTQSLFAVERYPTLWQMTSTVAAELRPEIGYYDVFRALFPCGSVTGAPKVRSMQLLAELEGAPRGVYTGAVGFFSPQQTVFNVAIRTLELDEGVGTFGVGSGIVIDSNPNEEFRECQLKAHFLIGPPHHSQEKTSRPDKLFLIETMLWNGAYPLLELHLDRLADSADYFGFLCDHAAIRDALEQHARQFSDATPRKVRLLLDADGEARIADEALPCGPKTAIKQSGHPERALREAQSESKDLRLHFSDATPDSIGRVCIAPHRTDSADPMLFHKTTHRPLYAQALAEAAHDGFDDVLFLNERGEVTEGAINNIFIEKAGRWFTPPVECGLLTGVYRRHLLETLPDIVECVLFLDDLRTADAIYISNAVRGLRRVAIVW